MLSGAMRKRRQRPASVLLTGCFSQCGLAGRPWTTRTVSSFHSGNPPIRMPFRHRPGRDGCRNRAVRGRSVLHQPRAPQRSWDNRQSHCLRARWICRHLRRDDNVCRHSFGHCGNHPLPDHPGGPWPAPARTMPLSRGTSPAPRQPASLQSRPVTRSKAPPLCAPNPSFTDMPRPVPVPFRRHLLRDHRA